MTSGFTVQWWGCLVKRNAVVMCRVAKLAGDKRADVAEKGFGRPFRRVIIAQSGVV